VCQSEERRTISCGPLTRGDQARARADGWRSGCARCGAQERAAIFAEHPLLPRTAEAESAERARRQRTVRIQRHVNALARGGDLSLRGRLPRALDRRAPTWRFRGPPRTCATRHRRFRERARRTHYAPRAGERPIGRNRESTKALQLTATVQPDH